MKNKYRLDEILVMKGYFPSVENAKRAVMAGLVYSNGERLDKPGQQVKINIPLTIKQKKHHYVSRGGLKLEKALLQFNVNVNDKIVIDIGSSTGGFTDCALQHGAKKSYAIDVGYNQLAWKLRQDNRVIVMERTNFRHITPSHLKEGLPNFATIDVSFISLKLILPVLKKLLVENSDVIALVKPQFEAPRLEVGEKGIVRDKNVQLKVLETIINFSSNEGYNINDITYSPITGNSGNIEFLLHLTWPKNNDNCKKYLDTELINIINEAHGKL